MKILVTGASGFVGKKLIYALASLKHEVIAVARSPEKIEIPEELKPFITAIKCDLSKKEDYANLPKNIDAAYFLVHSMKQADKNFAQLEQSLSELFVLYLNTTTAKQVIFLGGIISEKVTSKHMVSRQKVEEILKKAAAPYTILRAAIILGEDSLSYQILYKLTDKLPIMVAPKWINQYCQPISIQDVIFYLVSVLQKEKTFHQTFDIVGPSVTTFKALLYKQAEKRGLRRWILAVPVLTPKLSSYWLLFITRSNYYLGKALVESIKHNYLGTNDKILQLIQINRKEVSSSIHSCLDPLLSISPWNIPTKSPSSYYRVPKTGCYFLLETKKNAGFPERPPRNLLSKTYQILLESPSRKIYYQKGKMGEIWWEFTLEKNSLQEVLTFRPLGLIGRIFWLYSYFFHKALLKNV